MALVTVLFVAAILTVVASTATFVSIQEFRAGGDEYPAGTFVVRLDQPNLIVLSDGRVIPATAQTVVMVDNRAIPYTALHPGARVVIYPNGQAAVVTDSYPSAFPAVMPEAGLREKEAERNSP